MTARTSLCPGICSSSPMPLGSRPSRSGLPASPRRSSLLQFRFSCRSPYTNPHPRISGHVTKQSTTQGTHWNLVDLEYVRRYVSSAKCRLDGTADCLLERLVQLVPRAHLYKQQHTLIFVLRPALAHTYRVVDPCGKHRSLEHAVDLARAEAHPRRVQHAVASIQEF